jgi:hypothetical protein
MIFPEWSTFAAGTTPAKGIVLVKKNWKYTPAAAKANNFC